MEFKFMLAPLEDVSDNAFRGLCATHGADLTFTEMTRLTALVRDNKSTLQKIALLNDVPTQIQLAAQKEDNLKKFLSTFIPENGFAGINFNLGCPSPDLTRHGLGCALIRRVSKAARLVKIVKDYGHPCSIKMRLGLNRFEKEKKVYLNLIEGVDADFFVVHARHGSEHYEAKADYSIFPGCVDTGKTIIANGDINSVEKVQLLKEIGVKGVMVGRAAVRNPSIFERLKELPETDAQTIRDEYIEFTKRYPPSNQKYIDNVLSRLGKITFRDHVMG